MRRSDQEGGLIFDQDTDFSKSDEISRKSNPAIEKGTFPFSEKELLKGLTPITAHADLLFVS